MLMKTVFKVGMEVYDQVFFGKTPLKIKEVKADMSLRVLYGEVTYCYTGDGRFIGDDITSNRWRPLSQTPTLSTSPYTLQGFEQKEPVPTFEEAWEEAESIYKPKSEYDKEEYGGYPTQELADASEALRRLLFLRDYYNEGWQPDWKNEEKKFSIEIYEGEFDTFESVECQRVFSFKTEEIRDKFLEEQRELLEIAKPLL
jgi:hypothetical protein|nr:MAG TPA: hypothetical protein [Caudoviricetes sp.]